MAKVAIYGLIDHKGRHVNLDAFYGPYDDLTEAKEKLEQICETPKQWEQVIGLTVGKNIRGSDNRILEVIEYAVAKVDDTGIAENDYGFILKKPGTIISGAIKNSTEYYEIVDKEQDGKYIDLTEIDTRINDESVARTTKDTELENNKVDKPNEPIAGQGLNIPYYFSVAYEENKAVVTDYTVDLLDKTKPPKTFSLDILSATATAAGLLSKNDKIKLNGIAEGATKVEVSTTGTATEEVSYIKVNNTEYKLAGGGGNYTAGTSINISSDNKISLALGNVPTEEVEGNPLDPGSEINLPYWFEVVPKIDGTAIDVTAHMIAPDKKDQSEAGHERYKRFTQTFGGATTTLAGLMTAEDKKKLPDVPAGAGEYFLKAIRNTDGTIEYSWVINTVVTI